MSLGTNALHLLKPGGVLQSAGELVRVMAAFIALQRSIQREDFNQVACATHIWTSTIFGKRNLCFP